MPGITISHETDKETLDETDLSPTTPSGSDTQTEKRIPHYTKVKNLLILVDSHCLQQNDMVCVNFWQEITVFKLKLGIYFMNKTYLSVGLELMWFALE